MQLPFADCDLSWNGRATQITQYVFAEFLQRRLLALSSARGRLARASRVPAYVVS